MSNPSGKANGPAKGKVNSPSSTPAEATANCGGMPPIKSEDQIDKVNMPKQAPGAVHGT